MKFTGEQYAAVSGGSGIRFYSLNYIQARGEARESWRSPFV
jgi:general secretion pathway protein L